MKTIYGISHWKQNFKNPVVAIGVFDGLHLGHQDLMRMAVKTAQKVKGTPVVITFSPHPVQVLYPQDHIPLLTTLPHRLRLLESFGIQVCLVIHFTKKFSRIPPEQFIRRYIVGAIKAKVIIVGDDFRFGQDRSGTLDLFQQAGKKYGFGIVGRHQVKRNKKVISSTLIRRWIAEGNFLNASRVLGRPFSLFGKVVPGRSRGKKLGFPTANIQLNDQAIPPLGVYLVNVLLAGKRYRGLANIGRRPSFNKKGPINLEVHILNFKGNIYGKQIDVAFRKKIRDEKFFPTRQALIEQIRKDERQAIAYFQKHHS